MAMLKIDGVAVKSPSVFTWGFADLSSEESGRSTNDGRMIKDIIASKRTLSCTWNNLTPQETSKILQLVSNKVYMKVTYTDALSGKEETREFYVGDRNAPVKIWTTNKKIYSSLSFNFIER